MRPAISFRVVNRIDSPGHDPGLQRHHLLPRAILSHRGFAAMIDGLGLDRIGFDDFRRNGQLLPCRDPVALRMGLPLHRGPHRRYNDVVFERVGQVEAHWARERGRHPARASEEAAMRLALLQRALRRRLLDPARSGRWLNRRDPLGAHADFGDLDAMADLLWPATEVQVAALAALSTARTPAVATSSSTPTPQMVLPSGVTHST